MRILALHQGHYGQRIVEFIRRAAPADWTIEEMSPPRSLPLVIDDPEDFLPRDIPQADLLLALSESPETAQLVPAIARLAGARAVIMPVDNSAWLPSGLKGQVERELAGANIAAAFPKTFCTLTETTTGYEGDAEQYDSDVIAAFAGHFGRPRLKIEVDRPGGRISGVEVLRSAPCGSTHRVAEKLAGVKAAEAVPQAGLHCHHYPCLASMEMEPRGDTLMHISGYVVNEEVERALRGKTYCGLVPGSQLRRFFITKQTELLRSGCCLNISISLWACRTSSSVLESSGYFCRAPDASFSKGAKYSSHQVSELKTK